MIIDTQKWHEIEDRWHPVLRYYQEAVSGYIHMFDEDPNEGESKIRVYFEREETEKLRRIINKNDLKEWKIVAFQKDPFAIGRNAFYCLIETEDDTQNIQHKSLKMEELDELFYPYRFYESIISENRERFLDAPYKIQSLYHNDLTELIFQQKLDDNSYIYLMNFYLEDDEDPNLRHFHQKLVTFDKTEVLKANENPDQVFDEQIEIFRILKKEGIVNEN
jgi:hypothetical protein